MDNYLLDELRLAISLVIIGQQLLIAFIFLKDRPVSDAQWLGALLLLGSIAYLVQSNPLLREAAAPVRHLVLALAIAEPYLLAAFSIRIFEIRSVPRVLRFSIYAVPLSLWIAVFAAPAQILDVVSLLHLVAALLVITATVVSIYLSRRDDLLEPRRRYRTLFVLLIALQASAILGVELIFDYANLPDWLELANVLMIGALTLGLSLPLLTLDGRILWHEVIRDGSAGQAAPDALSPSFGVLRDALDAAAQNNFYREPGISILSLADTLNVPEHQLRKLINQGLGYRNFSAFLNFHRIGDAKARLSDVAEVRTPILTIAMNLGYGSISPFNRAFKRATGLTPSAYRRQQIGQLIADVD